MKHYNYLSINQIKIMFMLDVSNERRDSINQD